MSTHAPSPVPESPDDVTGLPGWLELTTPDPAAAVEFYASVLGWTFDQRAGGELVILVGDSVVGGLRAVPGDRAAWRIFLTVTSTASTAERATQLGGEVVRDDGLLVVLDPSGAEIGFCEADRAMSTGFPGTYTWADLNTWDGIVADTFYASLFGFDQQQVGDGLDVDYTLWSRQGSGVLGRLRMGPEFPRTARPHWMVSFEVAEAPGVDGCVARAVRHGGRVSVPPYDGPEGRAAVLVDPSGAQFTVLDRSLAVAVVPEEVLGARVDDPYDD